MGRIGDAGIRHIYFFQKYVETMKKPVGNSCLLLLLCSIVACAGSSKETLKLTRNPNWFACDKKFECMIVVDDSCRVIAVNRKSATSYLEWSRSLAGTSDIIPCRETGFKQRTASCSKGKCVEGIRFNK